MQGAPESYPILENHIIVPTIFTVPGVKIKLYSNIFEKSDYFVPPPPL